MFHNYNQSLLAFDSETLLSFSPLEELIIAGEKVQYGDAKYKTTAYEMFGCILWKDNYFVLEHDTQEKKNNSLFICEFNGDILKNYGLCMGVKTNSSEGRRKEFLVKFVERYIKNHNKK